jgi:predicted short-subunit dehydrogenase-like oxidoreductase (DUF2520 family)
MQPGGDNAAHTDAASSPEAPTSDATPATSDVATPRVVVVGAGRAGGSLAGALGAAGWDVAQPVGRHDDLAAAVRHADVVVIATPDDAIATVSDSLVGLVDGVVMHLSGSLGLEVLAGHARTGCVHPLVSLPSPGVGAKRLVGAWFAVAGDPVSVEVVDALQGRYVTVADADRAAYHAAACIAANHLVALLGQVERVAATAGVPLDTYMDLVRTTVDNVAAMGCAAALTGPASRGDVATIARHRAALGPDELEAYDAMMHAAQRLAGWEGEGSRVLRSDPPGDP